MNEPPHRTDVLESRASAGLRRGQVLAERYQIEERLRDDALGVQYRASDHEEEREVWVRVLAPTLFPDERARRECLASLRAHLGRDDVHTITLLDADREGPHLFVVSAQPAGVALAKVLADRSRAGKHLKADELLPVLDRLATALDALSPDHAHGDVRAENVWIEPAGLALDAGFVTAALPAGALAATLQAHPEVSAAFSPEARMGELSAAGDRWSAARLVHVALAGEEPRRGVSPALGPLAETLLPYLNADPARRPTTLRPLVDALAKRAGLPAPKPGDAGRERPAPRADDLTRVVPSAPPPPMAAPRDDDDDGDDALDELEDDAKTRQISLAELAASRKRRAQKATDGGAADASSVDEADGEELEIADLDELLGDDALLSADEPLLAQDGPAMTPSAEAVASIPKAAPVPKPETPIAPPPDEARATSEPAPKPRKSKKPTPAAPPPAGYDARPSGAPDEKLPPPVSVAYAEGEVLFDDGKASFRPPAAQTTLRIEASDAEGPPRAVKRKRRLGTTQKVVIGALLGATLFLGLAVTKAMRDRAAAEAAHEAQIEARVRELQEQRRARRE